MSNKFFELPVVADDRWQMWLGERFAFEGLLAQLRPKLVIETGTAQGGSLRRIASHAEEVHCFDIEASVAQLQDEVPNAHFHIGDSRVLLPAQLEKFEREGRQVDFALVDGDHSVEGVQWDMRALLESGACRSTVIAAHDAANDDVRAGLEALELHVHPRVALCQLDWIPGYLVASHHAYAHQIWNGLALIVLDSGNHGPTITDDVHYDTAAILRSYRESLQQSTNDRQASEPGIGAGECDAERAELDSQPKPSVGAASTAAQADPGQPPRLGGKSVPVALTAGVAGLLIGRRIAKR